MKRGEKFITILVLIALLSLWLMERPRITAGIDTTRNARRPAATAPAATGAK